MNIIENFDAVKILSYGASGLAFLLMFMAYSIIKSEQKQKRPRGNIIRSAQLYMIVSLVMTVFVGLIGLPAIRENQILEKESTELKVENYKLNTVQELDESTSILEDNAQNLPPDSIKQILETQSKKLDTLSKAIGKVDKKEKKQVENIKKNLDRKIRKLDRNRNLSPREINKIVQDIKSTNKDLHQITKPSPQTKQDIKKEIEDER